ncbi:11895_t:CDS:2, partial [Gigaspora rosea]
PEKPSDASKSRRNENKENEGDDQAQIGRKPNFMFKSCKEMP